MKRNTQTFIYIVTIQHGGRVFDVQVNAGNPSQAMANAVTEYPGALIVRVA